MHSSEFLSLSEYLMEGSSGFEEASYRTAANRAYLALALWLANILREGYGVDIPRSTRFYHVIEEQATDLDPLLGEDLRMLRRIRNNADYDLDLRFMKADAIRAVVLAKAMTALLIEKFR